jgi:hypothetical protein
MAIELQRPTRILINIAESPGAVRRARRARRGVAAHAVSIAVRGLLVGAGIGTLLTSSGEPGFASITVLGILALGAAMFSWDR